MPCGPGMRPITAVSTRPTRGTERFDRMIGIARRRMRPLSRRPSGALVLMGCGWSGRGIECDRAGERPCARLAPSPGDALADVRRALLLAVGLGTADHCRPPLVPRCGARPRVC